MEHLQIGSSCPYCSWLPRDTLRLPPSVDCSRFDGYHIHPHSTSFISGLTNEALSHRYGLIDDSYVFLHIQVLKLFVPLHSWFVIREGGVHESL